MINHFRIFFKIFFMQNKNFTIKTCFINILWYILLFYSNLSCLLALLIYVIFLEIQFVSVKNRNEMVSLWYLIFFANTLFIVGGFVLMINAAFVVVAAVVVAYCCYYYFSVFLLIFSFLFLFFYEQHLLL